MGNVGNLIANKCVGADPRVCPDKKRRVLKDAVRMLRKPGGLINGQGSIQMSANGSGQESPPLKKGAGGISIIIAAIATISCKGTQTLCNTNIECDVGSACVDGLCIDDKAECKTIGAFETVAESSPQHATKVSEFHLAFDTEGVLHYCYFGYDGDKAVSYYGKQTDAQSFEEEKISIDGDPVVCAGVGVAKDGTPYLLSKQPPSVMWKSGDQWKSESLEGFDTPESKSALRGDDTVVTLTRAGKDGVYITLSMGFQTANQPMYAVKATKEGPELLFDGQLVEEADTDTESNTETKSSSSSSSSSNSDSSANAAIIGHGPQIVETKDDARLIAGRVFQQSVVLAEVNLDILTETDGVYPRAGANEDGESRVAYINHNDELVVSKLDGDTLSQLVKLGNVYPTSLAPGHLPVEITVDDGSSTHLLYEDDSQGENAVVYQKVSKSGDGDIPVILTENLVSELPGSGLYALSTDICGRVVAAFIEIDENTESLPKFHIVQGR